MSTCISVRLLVYLYVFYLSICLSVSPTYTQVAAGEGHTVLLRSDVVVVACGRNDFGQCNIPALDRDLTYTQVAARNWQTVLLRSNGTVVACECNEVGEHAYLQKVVAASGAALCKTRDRASAPRIGCRSSGRLWAWPRGATSPSATGRSASPLAALAWALSSPKL